MALEVRRVVTEELREGDKITVAVTHEVKINRDSAWIRYEATSSVAGETTDEARARVIRHVSTSVINAVQEAADAVMSNTITRRSS